MALIYDTPLVNPIRGGLFSAATIIEQPDPSRLFDGLTVHSFNCGTGYGPWGLGCVSTVVEVQTVTLTGATSGTFTLSFNGGTTAPIPFDATPLQVQAALNAVPQVGAVGGVRVSGGPGNWTVTWNSIGNQPDLTIDTTGTDDGGGGDGVGDVDEGTSGVGVPKDGERVADTDFDGFGVWAADECSLKNKVEANAAARQKLRMYEQQIVEAEFAARLLADAPVATAPAAGEVEEFVRAVGELESLMGYLPGVIHADLHFMAWAQHLTLILPGGRTPNGHAWAFSAGYSALGDRLIGTGPVAVHRSSVNVIEGLDVKTNSRLMIAEREYLVSYECDIFSREVAV